MSLFILCVSKNNIYNIFQASKLKSVIHIYIYISKGSNLKMQGKQNAGHATHVTVLGLWYCFMGGKNYYSDKTL